MFDLDKALADWRKEVLQSGLTREESEELENHLRSRLQDPRVGELPNRESFHRALNALGSSEYLVEQFHIGRPLIRRIASRIMNTKTPVAILAATIILATTMILTRTQEPRYQMVGSEKAVLRLDTQTGNVCAVILFTQHPKGDCETVDGHELLVTRNLSDNYGMDFSGNFVRVNTSDMVSRTWDSIQAILDKNDSDLMEAIQPVNPVDL